MEDMIFQMPVFCPEEKGEPEHWHLSNYWARTVRPHGKYRTFWTVDYYGDGDHEPVKVKDLPSDKEQRQAWHEYYEWVARNAKDPLGQFLLSEVRKRRERWQFKMKTWIGASRYGLMFTGARKNCRGEWMPARDLPKDVFEFFLLRRVRRGSTLYTCRDFKTINDILMTTRGDSDVKWQRQKALEVKGIATIEVKYKDPTYKKKLVQLAREWVKRSDCL